MCLPRHIFHLNVSSDCVRKAGEVGGRGAFGGLGVVVFFCFRFCWGDCFLFFEGFMGFLIVLGDVFF